MPKPAPAQADIDAYTLATNTAINDLVATIYLPGASISYSGTTNTHPDTFVQVGHRQGWIDNGLVPVIQALWTKNSDTIGSCEEIGNGWAYIQFISPDHGANLFITLLQNANIPYHLAVDPLTIQGQRVTLIYPAIKVTFPNQVFPQIAAAIAAHP